MHKINILDIVIDEKFIAGIINFDKNIDNETHTYIFIKNGLAPLKFLDKLNEVKILSKREFKNLLKDHSYDAVFLHSLYSIPLWYFKYIPKTIPLFWFSWGYDVYNLPSSKPIVPISLYHTKTKELVSKKLNITTPKMHNCGIYRWVKKEVVCYLIHKALSRIDYHSGVLSYENELIKKYNKGFKAGRVQYNYISSMEIPTFRFHEDGDILIGNSAAPTNNHLDIMDYLDKSSVKNKKLIVPLNYAGTEEYVDKVLKEYNKLYDSNFIPLLTYMDRNDYFRLVGNCSIAIFMFERQQGVGNINNCLINGVKVFLSETSQLYSDYKNRGYIVYSIQSDLNEPNALDPLSENDQLHNYRLAVDDKKMWLDNRKDIRDKILLYQTVNNFITSHAIK